ncbi:DUF6873 family GME fold protein [Clostridium oceanicum]|uniref:DUF6873 domain-containing protein n=1 Tax=Clostridium oceanicum TaxID=1543 RepID=A0ABP3V7T4_9CLOT
MKFALVDSRISNIEKENLKKFGLEIICCPTSNLLYDAVCGHPDMLLNIIDKNRLLLHKDTDSKFINKLKKLNFKVILSKNSLKNKYPKDIILNAVNTKKIFMHNLKFTDPTLLDLVKNKNLINISQGYSKCSTAIVSPNAVMTSDIKIAKILTKNKFDVLLLPPGDILLPGLDYGFIGGCCGLIDEKTIAFYGNLKFYKYGNEVLQFLNKHNVKPIFLRNDKLIDRGSILCIENNL